MDDQTSNNIVSGKQVPIYQAFESPGTTIIFLQTSRGVFAICIARLLSLSSV